MKIALVILVCLPFIIHGQQIGNWTISSETNSFDGEVKYASISGTGGDYPYTSPNLMFIVRESKLTIYLSNIGTICTDGSIMLVIFDNDGNSKKVYGLPSESLNSLVFVFKDSPAGTGRLLTDFSYQSFIDHIKKSDILDIRVPNSPCGSYDYKFLMEGSSDVFNLLLEDYNYSEPIKQRFKKNIIWHAITAISVIYLVIHFSTY